VEMLFVLNSWTLNALIPFILKGTMHHGMSPVLCELAHRQIEPQTGTPYHVQFETRYLRYGLFGYPAWVGNEFKYNNLSVMKDQELVHRVISAICPNNGKHPCYNRRCEFPGWRQYLEYTAAS
jgi:hypothetical protein